MLLPALCVPCAMTDPNHLQRSGLNAILDSEHPKMEGSIRGAQHSVHPKNLRRRSYRFLPCRKIAALATLTI